MYLSLLVSLLLSTASAQQIKISDDPGSKDSEQTIEIRKKSHINGDVAYKIEEGQDNVDGDAAPMLKDARSNWKKACTDWKKEFRENNAGNKVIMVNCGTMKCETQTMETTCKSEASYKVRVKMTQDE